MDVFAPNMTMSRAMVVTVLWRLFGTPSIRINAKRTASDPALFASDGTSAEEKNRLTT